MAQQTAVEWLINELTDDPSKFLFLCDKPEYMNELNKIIKQAKAMEKEQIIEAFTKGELVKDNYYDYSNPFNIKGQNYYKKTYENNK